MADVIVDVETKNAKELLGQGIRAFILQDFNSAVQALSKASELLVTEHGDDLHVSLGDVYLYYGKALLGLSRDESEALGDAVPKNAEEDDSDEEVDQSGTAEVEEEDKEVEGNGEAEAKPLSDVIDEKGEGENVKLCNGSGNDNEPSSSSGVGGEDKAEDEELTDLQLAWEVLELAKKIFEKMGDDGRKKLAETLVVLGEISMESENFESAVNDIKEGLDIQKKLFSKDNRTVAETLYKLGMAYSTNSQIDEAVESFSESLEYLKNRIGNLEKVEDQKDPVKEEVKEIRELVPDIEEKIADMKSYKEEAIKEIVSSVSEPNKITSTSSSAATTTSAKANDISHLVKRKRKIEDILEGKEAAAATPAKRPST